MSVRILTDNERLLILAMIKYYTDIHYNKRVVQLLAHTLSVNKVDSNKSGKDFYNDFFNRNKAGLDVSGVISSSAWLNTRRSSIINKYDDEDVLKGLYKTQKKHRSWHSEREAKQK